MKIIPRTKAEQRRQNKVRTKEELQKEINEFKRDKENTLIYNYRKRRINVTINDELLKEIELITKNKSDYIEKLIIADIEKRENRIIEFTRY